MSKKDLIYKMGADTADFRRGMKSAEGGVAGFAKRSSDSLKKVGKAFAGVAAIGLGVMGNMVKESIDQADAMSKSAQAVGLTVEELSGLSYAAELSAVNFEALKAGLSRFNRTLGDAEQGLGRGAKIFDQLGVEMKDTATGAIRPTTDLLSELADKFAGVPDGAQKAALAQELFGRSGTKLIPLLNQGSAGIAELTAEAERLGLVIDTETAQAAERFNDNLTRMTKFARGVANTIMAQSLPALEAYSAQLIATSQNSNDFGTSTNFVEDATKTTLTSIESFRVVLFGLGKTFGIVGAEATLFFQGLGDRLTGLRIRAGKGIAEAIGLGEYIHDDNIKLLEEIEAREAQSAEGRRRMWEAYEKDIAAIIAGAGANFAVIDRAEAPEITKAEPNRDNSSSRGLFSDLLGSDDAKEAADQLDRELKYLTGIANQWMSKTASDTEKYQNELWDLSDALERGLIDEETFAQAKSQLDEMYDPTGAHEWQRNILALADGAEKVKAELLGVDLGVQEHLATLEEMHREGLLTWDEYAKAVDLASASVEKTEDSIKGVSAEMELLQGGAELLGSTLIDAIVDPFNTSIEDMVGNFSQALARMALEAAAQQALMALFGGGGGGGGVISAIGGFAEGGAVSGPGTGTSDSIVARLSDGEYVMPARTVQRYGVGMMDAMRRGDLPRFASGGLVGSGSGGSSGGGGVTILNSIDPSMLSEFLASASGEKIVMNHISKNARLVAQTTSGA